MRFNNLYERSFNEEYLLLRIGKQIIICMLFCRLFARTNLFFDSHTGNIIAGGRKMIFVTCSCIIIFGKAVISSRFGQVSAWIAIKQIDRRNNIKTYRPERRYYTPGEIGWSQVCAIFIFNSFLVLGKRIMFPFSHE